MVQTARYLATGFFNDAEKLLHEFSSKESVDFPVFAEIWKERNFVLVFCGRDKYQVVPFTNEIFQITLGFLENPSFYNQVGVFFLLYALFRHQLATPSVLIRITKQQYQVFKSIQNTAIEHKFKTLHYITDYLLNNSFDFVYSYSLFGPKTCKNPQDKEHLSFSSICMMRNAKAKMVGFQKSNILQDLKDLSSQYESLKEEVYSPVNQDVSANYEKYIRSLDNLINDRPIALEPRGSHKKADSNIGHRRNALKSKAFESISSVYRFNDVSDSEGEQKESKDGILNVRKRKRKGKKQPGRPKGSPNKARNDPINVPKQKSTSCLKRGPRNFSLLNQFNNEPSIKAIEVSTKVEIFSDSDEGE